VSNIVIVYFSQTGSTHELALAMKEGASSESEASVQLHRIEGSDIESGRYKNSQCFQDIDESDAVIFGSPTYMGGPAAQFKAFADASSERWESQKWANKIAAGFTVGSSPNGDQLATLQYFTILSAQHGMIWIGLDNSFADIDKNLNPQGTQLGLAAHCPTMPMGQDELDTAMYLGNRVATGCSRYKVLRT